MGAQFSCYSRAHGILYGLICSTTGQFFSLVENIGKLAVCGTVNDLAMNGAVPQYLSCGLILEEGLAFEELDEILRTMAEMAKAANIQIVTGDTKVVKKGEVDKIYINTAGIGMIPDGIDIGPHRVKAGMDIILSGAIGDHSIAVMGQRFGLDLSDSLKTDCAPLNKDGSCGA